MSADDDFGTIYALELLLRQRGYQIKLFWNGRKYCVHVGDDEHGWVSTCAETLEMATDLVAQVVRRRERTRV